MFMHKVYVCEVAGIPKYLKNPPGESIDLVDCSEAATYDLFEALSHVAVIRERGIQGAKAEPI